MTLKYLNIHIKENTIFVDKGYMGIDKIHSNSIISTRASKNHKLNEIER